MSFGPRAHGVRPFPPCRRRYWEFYIVVKGLLAPLSAKAEATPPAVGNTLWLFPPEHEHGWIAPADTPCRVVVFHYEAVPAALAGIAQRRGGISVQLSVEECRRFEQLAHELLPYLHAPSQFAAIAAERVLMELALVLLATHDETHVAAQSNPDEQRVLAAESWFRLHLTGNPPVEELAAAAGVSVTQLRRLFSRVRGQSPLKVMNAIRMKAALNMLNNSDAKLECIAQECGFLTASNFCAAFKALHGESPGAWRKSRADGH